MLVTGVPFPFSEPVVVITRVKSGVDSYGKDQFTEETVTVMGAFDPAVGYESTTSGSDQVVSQPQALLPYDTVVTSTSVLVIRGDRYEVDGTPNYWKHPSGWEPGVAVPLKRAVG